MYFLNNDHRICQKLDFLTTGFGVGFGGGLIVTSGGISSMGTTMGGVGFGVITSGGSGVGGGVGVGVGAAVAAPA